MSDPTDDALRALGDGTAWREFCDLVEKASAVLARDDLGLTDFDRAEGHRYLARLLQNGLVNFLESKGPRHPRLRSLPEHCGFGLDNPDNVYAGFGVDPRYTYRIRGTRGTISYLSFAAQNQNYTRTDRITGGAGHLNDDDLTLGPDGSFEILASVDPQPGDWLQLAPDTSLVLVRQTFADRAHEVAAVVEVECVGVDELPPQVDPRSVAHQLLGAAMYTLGASSWFADWVQPWRDAPNTMHMPPEDQHRLLGGDPNIAFQLGYWSLEPHQALVVEFTPPQCVYWNFQLGNIWAECLDKSRVISRNNVTATPEPDGSVRLVVAHADPGVPNWIDTCGHTHGIMGQRWVRADSYPASRCTVVDVATLS